MENLTQQQTQEKQERIRRSVLINITIYLIVIAFLAVVNHLASPGYWWVIWPALGWGLGLAISVVSRLLNLDTQNDGR